MKIKNVKEKFKLVQLRACGVLSQQLCVNQREKKSVEGKKMKNIKYE